MPRIVSCCVEKVHSNTTLCFGQEEETLGNAGAEEMSTTRPNYHIRKSFLIGGVRAPYSTEPTRTSCTKTLVGKIHGTHVVCSTQPCPTPRPHPQRKSCFSQKTKPTLFSPRSNRSRSAGGGEENVQQLGEVWASARVVCVVFGVCGWPRRGEARRGEATRPPCF